MRYPHSLPQNGTIGFLAPSFGCAIEPYYSAFQNSLKKWKDMGYETKLGPNCYESKGMGISNTPEACGAEVMESFLDGESDCLISCGGGELMCEILDYVDFDRLSQAEPKWYLGYSDNTNLTFLLTTLCDTASIYGPCAATFGMEPWHPSLEDAVGIFTGQKQVVESYDLWEQESLKNEEHPLLPYNVTEPRVHKLYLEDKWIPDATVKEAQVTASFSGRMLGGCMDCLINLVGTKYDKVAEFTERYKEEGIIWFLEACELNAFSIRRAMWQMEHAGWFKNVKGFLIGRPGNSETIMGLDVYQAVLSTAAKYHVPVIMDMDIGHVAPMMPLVTGSLADVQVSGNQVRIEMKYE